MMSVLSAPALPRRSSGLAFVEARVWPNGPSARIAAASSASAKMGGKSTRIGTYKCYECRKPFTVKVGTIFEASHMSRCGCGCKRCS